MVDRLDQHDRSVFHASDRLVRILILTQYFPPEMGAPHARLDELAVRLQDRGHELTVLTAMPNYPTGRIFPGYRRRLRMREDRQGLRIIRTALYPSRSPRKLPRLLSYLSFAASSLLLGTWRLGRQDLLLLESPPLFLVPTGLAIARLTRSRLVMNVSDIWPDILVRMGQASAGLQLRAMEWLERFGYRRATAVAVTNPGAAAQIKARFPNVVTTVISNGVDTALFRPQLRSEEMRHSLGAAAGDFLVGYCGLHGLAQGLEAVVEAAAILAPHRHIRFVMVGEGPTKDDLRRRASALKLDNLSFLNGRPKAQMPALLASCDLSLVPLCCALPGTMPSKIYEAMAAGTPPIVARYCEGEALIARHNAGRSFTPLAGAELAARIRELDLDRDEYERVRKNAIRLAARFDRQVIAERTERILTAIAAGAALPEVDW